MESSNTKYFKRVRNNKLYYVWMSMNERCYKPERKPYLNYGGRGITVCGEWRDSFEEFAQFALDHGWREGLCIDRINNNGNYEPDNVRFVTHKVNNRNRRNNTAITIDGTSHILAEWAEIAGIGRATIGWRYKNGIRGPDLLKKPGKRIEINGMSKRIIEWAHELHIPADTFWHRINSGMDEERLLQPLHNTGPKRRDVA